MHTGRPHFFRGWGFSVRWLTRIILFLAGCYGSLATAHAAGFVYCGRNANGDPACVAALRFPTSSIASTQASALCFKLGVLCSRQYMLNSGCASLAFAPTNPPTTFGALLGSDYSGALSGSRLTCQATQHVPACNYAFTVCESSARPGDVGSTPELIGPDELPAIYSTPAAPRPTAVPPVHRQSHEVDFSPAFSKIVAVTQFTSSIVRGVGIGIGILLVLFLFLKRSFFVNFIIHGNLPYKLPVYGEDIQCLFKRTQRVNWYGRVVFGIVANLAMTHQQLIDVRKYWLGRVIAFDSLRRQRQNELAKMHVQLAANVSADAKDKKPFSQFLAALKLVFLFVFYLIRALFSFLFGFLFIRVTIAKLVRGTVIESKDLTLVLQAKEAVEQSATYLKEYLETANTFDGRDEVI